MSENLSSLISELREQVLYMQELGVDSVDSKFQIPDFKLQVEVSSLRSQVSGQKPEFVVPDIPIVQKVEKISTDHRPPTTDTGRLSRLPKLSDLSAPKEFQKPVQSIIEVMPKKPVETTQEETLFGDISQTLPDSNETLADIQAEIGPDCTRCTLCENRKQVVNSTGNQQTKLMFIGEAPGADEDAQGKPFVGRAGQLLNKIIEAIGMKREDVFIGNINRCRPPQNRQPLPPEVAACKPFLLREIAVVRPKVIVVLGNTACQNLLDTKVGITKLRGNFQDYFGVKVMPTFHPAYLLRDPSKKRETWEDMKKVRDYLNSLE
jgi:uracil-DNA glycosylase